MSLDMSTMYYENTEALVLSYHGVPSGTLFWNTEKCATLIEL